jgi:hypothetical protein
MATEEAVRRRVNGLSEAAFRKRFGTEEQCRHVLFAIRWNDGFTCPVCEHGGFCALRTRKVLPCNRFRNGPLGVKSFRACPKPSRSVTVGWMVEP